MKKRFQKVLEKPWAAYTFATCAAVVLFLIFSHFNTVKNACSSVWNIFSPVVTGIIIAYLFNPVSNFFERTLCKKLKTYRGKHILAVVLTIMCVIVLLAIFLLALIPSLVKSIALIIKNWNVYTGEISEALNKISAFFQRHNIHIDLTGVSSMVDNSLDKIIDYSKTHYKAILDTVGDVGVGVTHFAFGVIYGFCFLLAKRGIIDCANKVRGAVLTKEVLQKRNQMWGRFHKIFIKYVGSTLLDALIVGVTTLIFMLIARMPYAPLIALVVGVTNIIPTVGPWIGSIIGVFFLVLESPIQALIFFIGVTVIQCIDGMVIKTKLFKGTLGIPGSWSFVLLILGGEIAGIAGILLSIPFAAIFMIVYTEYIVPRLEKRKELINAGHAPDTPETPAAEENEKDNE